VLDVLVQAELEGSLDGEDALVGTDLGGERAEKGRLSGACGAGDHDVLACPDQRREELAHLHVDRLQADQVLESDPGMTVASDRNDRLLRHGLDGVEP